MWAADETARPTIAELDAIENATKKSEEAEAVARTP